MDDLISGKSTEPDGLSAGFYKAFKHTISPVLCRVLCEGYKKKKLPPSFSRSYTLIISKTDDKVKLRQVAAYEAISLTNVDYKIFMKNIG